MRDEFPFAKQVYGRCHVNVHIAERELDVKLPDSHLSGELTNLGLRVWLFEDSVYFFAQRFDAPTARSAPFGVVAGCA